LGGARDFAPAPLLCISRPDAEAKTVTNFFIAKRSKNAKKPPKSNLYSF